MSQFNIMDTTLRDGSYAINFSFSSNQTQIISKALENCGLKYIEIGHGVGLNASLKDQGRALQTDEEYIQAAKNVTKTAKIGVFCIPEIAELIHLEKALKNGIDFVRIGTNANDIEKSKPFIELAKKHNIEVFANYMKSYTLTPKEFANKVKLSSQYGADCVYIVDSSGGMFSKNIKGYVEEIKSTNNIKIGFHAHDNLGLAIANNLACIEMGVDFIDSSLQGLGRSAGNASTEVLVANLLKLGYPVEIDLLKLMEISHKYVLPLVSSIGKEPLDIISGYADFHSSYMGTIEKYSKKYSINPLSLIIENCKINKVDISEQLLENLAIKIKEENKFLTDEYNFNRYFGHEQN